MTFFLLLVHKIYIYKENISAMIIKNTYLWALAKCDYCTKLLLTYTEVDMEVRKSKVGVPEWRFSLRYHQF